MKALNLINIKYEVLPVVNSIKDVLKQNAILVHENLNQYKHAVDDVYPEQNTNISDRIKIRKGDMAKGWAESQVIVEANLKIGASKDGIIKVLEAQYMVDVGAYADIGPRIAKAMVVDCSGPYNIENVWCDSICVYTNHTYVTSYRGFGHAEYTFCMERMMDKLASKLVLIY